MRWALKVFLLEGNRYAKRFNDLALERKWKYDTNINLDIQIIKDGPGESSWANGYQFEEAL